MYIITTLNATEGHFRHIPACLAYLALRTLPAGAYDGVDLYGWVKAVAMVMLATAGAKELLKYAPHLITHHAHGFFRRCEDHR